MLKAGRMLSKALLPGMVAASRDLEVFLPRNLLGIPLPPIEPCNSVRRGGVCEGLVKVSVVLYIPQGGIPPACASLVDPASLCQPHMIARTPSLNIPQRPIVAQRSFTSALRLITGKPPVVPVCCPRGSVLTMVLRMDGPPAPHKTCRQGQDVLKGHDSA